MYKCLYCDYLFDYPKIIYDRACREHLYTCPRCGEWGYDEAVQCCECGEYEYERKAWLKGHDFICEKCYEKENNDG